MPVIPEYWLIADPDDPHTVTVHASSLDDISRKPLSLHLVAQYTDKPDTHLSLGTVVARHVGALLIHAADTLDARHTDNESFNTILSGSRTRAEKDTP
ncbi:hypothetical protein ACFV2N_47605 [Streptomyces sp. NPDC059680]|uniref:hypothetical protein n=1 Tax=Streptomyces sp. NPDC059680 TaxID=3346904 RepID=UPI0036BE0BD7